LLFAVVWDLVRRTRWAMARSVGFLVVYFGCESIGVMLAFCIWIFSGRFLGLGKRRFLEWTYWLQRWWGGSQCRMAFRLFGLRMAVDGYDDLDIGPLLLFFHHASVADASMRGLLFLVGGGMRIRHVLKSELLWDPVLDILGSRLPHCFVQRGLIDNEKELAGVRRLMENLEPDEGVMIFPEGTRFTPEKRERILEKLAAKNDTGLLEKAGALKNVLPPRLGGSLALLDKNLNACAVFCAHVGLEATTKMWDFLNGSLVNRTILVKLWKVPFDKIPKTREARIAWLYENWNRIDQWIEKHKNAHTRPGAVLPEPNFHP
ncbi:MAG: 1-acyl-sn-glycerol-3-phosphate acyltransferase, partial [Pseudomonadota bacterium]